MKDIYGWRARLGLIYGPSWVMDPEFYAMSPEGVITCVTRVNYGDEPGATLEGLANGGKQAIAAAKTLGETKCTAIIQGCTSASFLNGVQYNNDQIKRMEDASGVPCTTTTTALIHAMQALNVEKISVCTPYIPEVNDRAVKYFKECGIEVCNIVGLNMVLDEEMQSRTPEQNYWYAKETMRDEADAVLILCTALRTIPILEALETDIGKPALSAIQASFWDVLRLAGVNDKIDGFGSLLRI